MRESEDHDTALLDEFFTRELPDSDSSDDIDFTPLPDDEEDDSGEDDDASTKASVTSHRDTLASSPVRSVPTSRPSPRRSPRKRGQRPTSAGSTDAGRPSPQRRRVVQFDSSVPPPPTLPDFPATTVPPLPPLLADLDDKPLKARTRNALNLTDIDIDALESLLPQDLDPLERDVPAVSEHDWANYLAFVSTLQPGAASGPDSVVSGQTGDDSENDPEFQPDEHDSESDTLDADEVFVSVPSTELKALHDELNEPLPLDLIQTSGHSRGAGASGSSTGGSRPRGAAAAARLVVSSRALTREELEILECQMLMHVQLLVQTMLLSKSQGGSDEVDVLTSAMSILQTMGSECVRAFQHRVDNARIAQAAREASMVRETVMSSKKVLTRASLKGKGRRDRRSASSQRQDTGNDMMPTSTYLKVPTLPTLQTATNICVMSSMPAPTLSQMPDLLSRMFGKYTFHHLLPGNPLWARLETSMVNGRVVFSRAEDRLLAIGIERFGNGLQDRQGLHKVSEWILPSKPLSSIRNRFYALTHEKSLDNPLKQYKMLRKAERQVKRGLRRKDQKEAGDDKGDVLKWLRVAALEPRPEVPPGRAKNTAPQRSEQGPSDASAATVVAASDNSVGRDEGGPVVESDHDGMPIANSGQGAPGDTLGSTRGESDTNSLLAMTREIVGGGGGGSNLGRVPVMPPIQDNELLAEPEDLSLFGASRPAAESLGTHSDGLQLLGVSVPRPSQLGVTAMWGDDSTGSRVVEAGGTGATGDDSVHSFTTDHGFVELPTRPSDTNRPLPTTATTTTTTTTDSSGPDNADTGTDGAMTIDGVVIYWSKDEDRSILVFAQERDFDVSTHEWAHLQESGIAPSLRSRTPRQIEARFDFLYDLMVADEDDEETSNMSEK